jgi:hypothetical protein
MMDGSNNGEANQLSSDVQSKGRKSLADLVTNLGKKARARLEEERSKRPEIVRLDASALPPASGKTAASSKSVSLLGCEFTKFESHSTGGLLTAVPQKRKRRRVSTPKGAVVRDKNVDRWTPSTSSLTTCKKDNRSRLVQLHGLPVGATTLDIRRFFSGLDPQRILLLPSYIGGKIAALDASESPPRKKGGLHAERYTSQLRIFVLFKSGPTATLAADRSGEVMPHPSNHPADPSKNDDGSLEHATGAAVAVSQVPKSICSHLLKNMVIDVTQDTPVHRALEQVEGELDPLIGHILWESAKHVLQLRSSGHDSSIGKELIALEVFKRVKDPTTAESYCHLVQHRASLQDMYDKLLYQLPFPSAELLDPSFAEDPVVRLKAGAAECIHNEIKRLDDQRLRARRWRLGLGKYLDKAE